MKIFWSWQSDLPGKISRHFVREALEQAVDALNQERSIEEPERPEASLDHDRKGVPGSPDLANTILEKVRNSEVFVADVTPVGRTANAPPKKLMNPNVAIELGYALHTLGDRRMIMIMNSTFGGRGDLPFDLQHKAGPIFYDLARDAKKEQIEFEKKRLVAELKIALRNMATAHSAQPAPFARVAHIDGDPARYFQLDELVVNREGDDDFGARRQLLVPKTALVFLRVIPTQGARQLTYKEAREALSKTQVRPFSHDWSSRSVDVNRWGAIAYQSIKDQNAVHFAIQVHRNSEVWGFNSYLPSPNHTPKNGGPPGIWAENLEEAFQRCLPNYVQFLAVQLGVPPPYTVIAGLSGVSAHTLAVPSIWGNAQRLGPFLQNPLSIELTLSSTEIDAINSVLLKIFEGIFEAVGAERPRQFRNFPKPPAQSGV